ncbi:MAG: H-NS histone family protein [Rhodoferax sp.]|nr:H-NS histone family protein [Rhodoferax sp.]
MTRTLVQIRQQIENLEKEAEKVKAKEIEGVIGRIREAIDFYNLTVEDVFGKNAPPSVRPKSVARRNVKKTDKTKSPPRFKDPASDRTWTGHGKRPGWFVQAISDGKKAEELAI